MSEEKIEISRSTYEQLKALAKANIELRAQLRESDKMFDALADCVVRLACAFGLGKGDKLDEIDTELLTDKDAASGAVMRNLGKLVLQFPMYGNSRAITDQIDARFAFFNNLLPIIKYYYERKGTGK